MSFDGEPNASDYQPSSQEVMDQAVTEREELSVDLLSRYPTIAAKVTELAIKFPDFKPNLNDQEIRRQAASVLIVFQGDALFFEPDYDITQKDDNFILKQLQERIVVEGKDVESKDQVDDVKTLLEIRDELTKEHGGINEAYLKAFQALLNDPEALSAKFTAIAAARADIEFDGTFSSRLAERIKLVNDNIAALQTMAGASPAYAAQVEKAGVDVTDRQAVHSFVAESGFMEDANVSETTKSEVAQKLGIVRTATSMLAALDNVKSNDGQFINEDGQLVTFNADNGVPVGRYIVYPDPTDNTEYIATSLVGGRELRVPFSPADSPAHLGRIMKAAMVTQVLANRDFQGASRYILGGDGLAAQGMAEIKLDEVQVARAERLFGAFMGLGSVVSTEFPSESELLSFQWRLQATHIDGDAKTNDNTGRGDVSWQRLGLLDQSGQLNMDQVEAVGAFMNTRSTSLPSFAELEMTFGPRETSSF